MSNPVCWFEIYVNDMDRAKKFYESLFNLQLTQLSDPNDTSMEMWTFPSDMQQYGATGSLVKMDGMPVGGNSTVIYFSSEDCAIEQARIEAAGGQIQQAKMSIGEHGHIVLGIDTEGNLFGIHSME
ncbi:VOC family protein [Acinetobacter piscicola]|uniref:VOC family protein n=1 Tax=Acinetobacter piscicola TaxID=2006115 RepID=UPI000B7D6A4D|nr:VOC family protein [Acinetobacter piscicola]